MFSAQETAGFIVKKQHTYPRLEAEAEQWYKLSLTSPMVGGALRGGGRLPEEGSARLPVGKGEAARDFWRTQAGGAGREARLVPALGGSSHLLVAAESHQVCKSVS